jgi:hypothetical protein
MTYTIEDNLERYTRFISKLRDNVVTSSHNPYPDEGVISSAPAAKCHTLKFPISGCE